MNIQQLKILIELSKGRSLQETAAALQLTQPTVSFHLRKLEAALGVQLVYKKSRSLGLTRAGAELVPYAKRIAALLDEARTRMDEHSKQFNQRLRLGASYTPATFFMPPYLQRFQLQHPETQLMLTVNQAHYILDKLHEYEVDVAIVSLPDGSYEGLTVHKLIEDELKLVFSPEHPLAGLSDIDVSDLSGAVFLLHEPGSTSRKLTDEWAEQAQLQLNQTIELGAIETIKEAVRHNMGVSALPFRSVQRELAAGDLIIRDLPHYRNRRFISLVYRGDELHAAAARSFIQFALQTMLV